MDDLIGEFIAETNESLAALDSELVNLERNPDDPELLGNIFRLMHTIKGTCGFLGLQRLESVAHAAENILGKVRDGKMSVTPDVVTVILEAIDQITQLIAHLGETGAEPEGSDSELIGRLDAIFHGGGGGAPAAAAHAPAPAPVTKEEATAGLSAEELAAMSGDTPAEEKSAGEVTLDELEALFLAAPGPDDEEPAPVPVAPVAAAAPSPATPKLAPEVKQKAIETGLDTPVPADGGKGKAAAVSATQSIRVNLDVLENLMQQVSELVLTRNQLLQIMRQEMNDNQRSETHADVSNLFTGALQRLSHITTELQEGVMKTRMQPIGGAWSKFPRLVRDLSMELGKKIDLVMEGEDTELDRQLLEMIKDPLTHMVRNSCDHGLEKPEEREKAGKNPTGTIKLHAYHEGGHILIDVIDDGRGLNIERIKTKAIENGLTTPDAIAQMSEKQIMQFVFKPGFSTAAAVTNVSGRGVGMDVVVTNIEKIGGHVDIQSTQGRGSVFQIKIPLTLAIVSVLIVESGDLRFAIPQINVLELVRVAADSEYRIESINNAPVLRLRNRLLPLLSLSKALRRESTKQDAGQFVVVCRVGGYDFGIIVDRVFDTEEIVVKPLSPLLQDISVYSGCTILGDGSVVFILDPNGLAKAMGEPVVNAAAADSAKKARRVVARRINFMMFKAGDDSPKAVPLELVSRIEEISAEKVERPNGVPVVQYRDDLMRLLTIDGSGDFGTPEDGLLKVLVFNHEGRVLGLVVDEINDIVETALDIKLSSDDERFIGSMVIEGRTTNIVDVGYVFSQVVTDFLMLRRNEENEEEETTVRPSVLLVEDSAFVRNLMAPFLSASGFDVVTAVNGKEGLDRLKEDSDFSLIISDIEMPVMDGFAFAEACTRHPTFSRIPKIAFTAKVTAEAIQKGGQVGFNDYIAKTDREGLLKTITRLLEEKEAA